MDNQQAGVCPTCQRSLPTREPCTLAADWRDTRMGIWHDKPPGRECKMPWYAGV